MGMRILSVPRSCYTLWSASSRRAYDTAIHLWANQRRGALRSA